MMRHLYFHQSCTKRPFSGCEYALQEMADGIKAKPEPGKKIRRYDERYGDAGNTSTPGDGENSKVKISQRQYDVSADKIKGYEKLDPEESADVGACKLMRYIVVLDETGYTIKSDGNAVMTKASQEEYDDFVSKIQQEVAGGEYKIIDEGYGSGEDELEWHITFTKDTRAGIMEIDTCARAEDVVKI